MADERLTAVVSRAPDYLDDPTPIPATVRWSQLAYSAVFAPLTQLSRPNIVARRLADGIALGVLRDGEQLPSESELADEFGVSTVSVRQALGMLREQGLIATRRGRNGGSFVKAPGDTARDVVRARLRDMSMADLRDLCDHYRSVNGAAAALAAARVDDEDADRIRAAAAVELPAADRRAHRHAEGQFHLEVTAASQSPRLTREEIALQREIAPVLWLPITDATSLRTAAAHHVQLAEAVAAGDAVAARSAAEHHIDQAFAWARELKETL
ncbi:GntR family transcriptional regulator [Microbacterium sp. SYP-A9085]|uniref:FadR/GntR family transcriptional regulator n=1 Tax=Microbacterium sp. SYP-A9085 TaxID=2664454 RepID=UPI00129A1FA6|nr:GntR family transcriptional regulator [Microbacterium sp. SYP-A9085]MRH29896.1 GntR family transcriptional regulator [Microbacterium sp. SYP-A9085]